MEAVVEELLYLRRQNTKLLRILRATGLGEFADIVIEEG